MRTEDRTLLTSSVRQMTAKSRRCVQRFVHYHALGVPVVTKADCHYPIFFGFDGLVDVPARRKGRKYSGLMVSDARVVTCMRG
jgi:hypothetical protein